LLELRPYSKLGGRDRDWLSTRHHFAFDDYFDPARVSWGSLRVWNDDEIAPGTGFPPHPHANMEIVTYVLEGAVSHKDSLGNEGKTLAGDVQVMSAGTGIRHAEYNLEKSKTHLFQIWIVPSREGGAPSWGTKPFPKSDRSGRFIVLASGFGEKESLPISAQARVLGATLEQGQSLLLELDGMRHAYLVPARGEIAVNGVEAGARDGVAIMDESRLEIVAQSDAELVLVETAD